MRRLAPLAAVSVLAAGLTAPGALAGGTATDSFSSPTGESWKAAAPPKRAAPKAAAEPKPAKPAKPVVLVRAAAGASVTIKDFSFRPATIEVKAGDTVTWRNDDSTDHTATGETFDTGVLSKGTSGSFTFKRAGTFAYVCSIHATMKGTVRVAAAASDSPAPAPAPSAPAPTPAPNGGTGGARLPRTGGEQIPIAGAGALMVLLGAGLARRRAAR
jgi:LPXTG-motif cell wall-anchored protein